MKFYSSVSYTTLLGLASAHSTFVALSESDTSFGPVSYGIRDPSYDGPINDVTTVRCLSSFYGSSTVLRYFSNDILLKSVTFQNYVACKYVNFVEFWASFRC
jgi:hypothetical protein